jgi:ribosomal protein S18 acetylase RimI-like enzyme
MKVREIVKADRESYRQLRSTLDKESPMFGAAPGERERLDDYAGSQFDEVMDCSRSIILVAEESDLLIGFISLETSGWKSLSGTTILMVGVLSSHQGKGVSSMLFECSEGWAFNNDIHRIELTVFAINTLAISLYEKRGYIQEGIRKESSQLDNFFYDEIYMAKLLSKVL